MKNMRDFINEGEKGLRVVMVDVFNREKGSFSDGQYDTSAVSGLDLHRRRWQLVW